MQQKKTTNFNYIKKDIMTLKEVEQVKLQIRFILNSNIKQARDSKKD